MKNSAVLNVLMEANRLIALGRNLETETYGSKDPNIVPGKDAAAFKRASLDLTRALAAVRKS